MKMIALSAPVLLAGVLISIAVGPRAISFAEVFDAFTQFDASNINHAIVRDMRLPHALACLFSGLSLAVAGAVMQGLSRNPIAGPSLLGLGGGASLALVLALFLLPGLVSWLRIEICMLGAAAGAALVFGFATLTRGALTPAKLALIGINVSALLASACNGIILSLDLPQEMISWFSRGMQGIGWGDVLHAMPWILSGGIGALLLSADLNISSLGEATAINLGQRTNVVRVSGAACVIALAGSAYSFVGPVAFIGVLVPHIARSFVGLDYSRVIPCAGLLGATFLLYTDILARWLERSLSSPLPVSLLCALVGAPCFLLLFSKSATAWTPRSQ